jgi:hypothetical protein
MPNFVEVSGSVSDPDPHGSALDLVGWFFWHLLLEKVLGEDKYVTKKGRNFNY